VKNIGSLACCSHHLPTLPFRLLLVYHHLMRVSVSVRVVVDGGSAAAKLPSSSSSSSSLPHSQHTHSLGGFPGN
jgi:hypothetical protein